MGGQSAAALPLAHQQMGHVGSIQRGSGFWGARTRRGWAHARARRAYPKPRMPTPLSWSKRATPLADACCRQVSEQHTLLLEEECGAE